MSSVNLRFDQLVIPPGHQVWLKDINWTMFEDILEELSESKGTRLTYCEGVLELMSPLAQHEDSKSIIGDLIKAILEEMGAEFRALGSTTFKNQRTGKAVEPDECFYIEHELDIRGKSRINLEQDPPPDLVLEIDLTSHTHLDIYVDLNVPEVWLYADDILSIYVLRQGHYTAVETSPHFPDLAVREAIPRCLIESRIKGRTTAIKAFRAWVRETLDSQHA